ncbi:MAG: Omp28-related outer membrane protein [Bacteroidetes bacterium]|nr:Omp28-related outer membrane protein [Bacteroidota bacterium]
MKKALLVLPLAALLFTVSSCKKEVPAQDINNISTTYKPLVVKFSATWCGACGSVGYPVFKDIASQHGSKITLLNVNTDDDINSGTPPGAGGLLNYFDVSGIPSCGVNLSEGFYPDVADINDSITAVRAVHTKAKAGIGFSLKVEGNNAVITTKTVAFEALTGRYSLAVYLTEDNIEEEQSGLSSGTGKFDHIFRGAADGQSWGAPIITTSCEAGAVFDKKVSIPIPADVRNRNNLHAVVVLYKIDPTSYMPVDVINTNHN